MRKARVAAVCSFLVPGAGLVYLGRMSWGIANLALATVAVLWCGSGSMSEHIHYVFLAVAAGSAGLAHAVATAIDGGSEPAGT